MPETAKTPERKAAEKAAATLATMERRTAKALLKVERRGVERLRVSVARATDAVVAATATGGSAARRVRHELPALQNALHADVIAARHDARDAGRARLEAEIQRPLQPVVSFAEDDAAAASASTTLAGAWSAAALAAIASDATPRELAQLTRVIDGRVRRTAVTETALAFNDERHALLIDLEITLGGHRGHGPAEDEPRPGMFKVWSAVLDSKTCPRCFAADGQVIELAKPFKSGESPPLHPFCRCVVEHVIVPKPERLEDIAIDYDLFKQELRDVIRENRAISDRRALPFISESLGGKRSPVTLTKRFTREDYVTRR